MGWLRLAGITAVMISSVVAAPAAMRWAQNSAALPGLSRAVAENDIIRVIADMNATNGDIGRVNGRILVTLEQVQADTARIEQVHRRLLNLESLVTQQNTQLDQLARDTAEQTHLSRELEAVTASIRPATGAMAETAALQAELVEDMAVTTRRLAGRLHTISALNRSTARKLERAEELSALVLSRMP